MVTLYPAFASSHTVCEPMKPHPPTTSMCWSVVDCWTAASMSCSSKRIDLSVKGVKTSSQSDPYGDGPGLEAPEEVLQGIF